MKLSGPLLAILLLCPALADAQTVTSIGASAVKAADDFATRAFQDPWDMNQRTDLGPLLGSADQPVSGFTNISFASGLFSGTTTTTTANVWLLDTGNPFAAATGKMGTLYPIDANTYRILAVRMSAPTSAVMVASFTTSNIYQSTASTVSAQTTAGFRTYLIDLGASSSWTGTKRSLQLSPSQGVPTSNLVQIDWARLVSVDASLCRAIEWGGSTVNIYLDNNNVASDGNLGPIALGVTSGGASAGCSPGGSGYSYYAGALPAGTYHVVVVNSGFPPTDANYSSTPWVVNETPTLTFTSPSEEGSDDDFATTQLGNPWDMNALSDVDFFAGVNGRQIANLNLEAPDGTPLPNQRVLYGTSAAGTAPCPATPGTLVGDPIVELLENNKRGLTKQIDADRYRLLTVEFGLPSKTRDINCGSVARIVWRAKGNTPTSVSDDIIFNSRAGTNLLEKVTLDLKTLKVEGLGGPNWVNGPGGGIDIFRFDPHEFTPATPFFIKRIKLAAFEKAKTSYTIRWNYSKAAGTIDLFYSTTPNDFVNGQFIDTVDATTGQYSWLIPAQLLGPSPGNAYYIYGKFTDGTNTNQVYAKQPVLLDVNYVARPRMVLSRQTLNFGITAGTLTSGPQTVRVSFVGAGVPCWKATSSNANFALSPSTRTGAGAFTVSLVPQVFPGGGSGQATITVSECTPNTILNPGQQLTATYRIASAGTAPAGAVDTPANGATVSGSLGVTGWVVDDVEVTSVKIYRNPQPGEAADVLGRVYLGDAVKVEDARPDIEALYPTRPFNYRAGWGYLLLTNFLPAGGNGTFVLRVYATDRDGHQTLLGSRTIVAANTAATRPFGAIDTPFQGETISSAAFNNFGWVLARGPWMASPTLGGSVSVLIDGVVIGSPGAWGHRGDLDDLFPAATYPGITHALGVYTFDTRTYEDGVHTIAWVVTTDNGESDGIGSRYFNIANASSSVMTLSDGRSSATPPAARTPGNDLGRRASEVARVDMATAVASAHGAERTPVAADASGRRLILSHQLERVVVDASSAGASGYEAYRVVAGRLVPLPPGASFDRSRGILYWQPGVGFTGDYDFEIVASGSARIPVRIVLQPQRQPATRVAAAWRVDFGSSGSN
jgi:hypothetical protein